MHQMVQGDQLSKIFSAVLGLTATSIYSNNQSIKITIYGKCYNMQHNSGDKNHKNLKNSYPRPQSHFKSEKGIAYFFVKIAAPCLQVWKILIRSNMVKCIFLTRG